MRSARLPLGLIAVGLVLILLAGYWWWGRSHPAPPRSMTEGTITSRAVEGKDLLVTVDFRVGHDTHSVTGRVDRNALTWQGGAIWVCYEPADPDVATLRLPYDPWCNVK